MHTLVIGRTGSGKSHLARRLAQHSRKQRRRVILYDPLGNPFPCDKRTSSGPELLDILEAEKDCSVFVDEAPTICTNLGAHRRFEWLATMSRHRGHRVYFLAQDATQLAPIYRRNCTHLYLFSVAPASAELLAKEFGDDVLTKAAGLNARWFFYKTSFGPDGKPFIARLCSPVS